MKKIFSLIILSMILLSLLVVSNVKPSGAFPLNPQLPVTVGGDLHMVESADFDADGNNDLVVTDGKGLMGIGVLFGKGDGTFGTPIVIGDKSPYEYGLKVVDLNNDSWVDIVVVNGQLSQLQIYINDGAGGFLPELYVGLPNVGNGHGNLDIGDLNGDGYVDLVVPGANEAFHVLLNDTTANFPSVASYSVTASAIREEVALGDLNMDGILDLVVTSTSNNSIEVFSGDGDGAFSFDNKFPAIQPYGVVIEDLNGDFKNDIIFTQYSNGDDVIATDISGGVLYTVPAGLGVYVRAQDINLDGYVDIIFSDEKVNGIRVALGNGSSFDAPADYIVNVSPLGLAINDFDNDGLPDVAAVNHGDTLSIFLTDLPKVKKPGVSITNSPTIYEGGAQDKIDVVLDSNPQNIVFVNLSTSGVQSELTGVDTICFVPSGESVYPGTVFDPCNVWNEPRGVEISAIDDLDVEGTHSDKVNIKVESKDPDYNFSDNQVEVKIYDNDAVITPAINN